MLHIIIYHYKNNSCNFCGLVIYIMTRIKYACLWLQSSSRAMCLIILSQQKISSYCYAVTRTWQSQDACTLSWHCEPCKQSSWSQARNSQENRPFLTASGMGTRSPTWTIAVHEKRPSIFTPANARYPGWTGGRQMENRMEKLPELGLNTRTSGPEPRPQPLHHTATTITHTLYKHIQPHTHTHIHTLECVGSSTKLYNDNCIRDNLLK